MYDNKKRPKYIIDNVDTKFRAVCGGYDKDIDCLVQDCSNSIANALELLQSCTKPLIS